VDIAVGLYIVGLLTCRGTGIVGQLVSIILVMLVSLLVGLYIQRKLIMPRRGFVHFNENWRARYRLLFLGIVSYLLIVATLSLHPYWGEMNPLVSGIAEQILSVPAALAPLYAFVPIALVAYCLSLPRMYSIGAIWALIFLGLVIYPAPYNLQPHLYADDLIHFTANSVLMISWPLLGLGTAISGLRRLINVVNAIPVLESCLDTQKADDDPVEDRLGA
jgi:hypothetical protein